MCALTQGLNELKFATVLKFSKQYDRIRVLWSGAEYRGHGRNTQWIGRAQFSNTTIANFETINQWNHEALFEQQGSATVIWKTVNTGNLTYREGENICATRD